MANEARINSSLQISNVTSSALDYASRPSSFNADVGSGAAGPTPGIVVATVQGVSVDLTKITTPGGFCRIINLDPTNFVEVGIWDPEGATFYPLMELLAEEFYVIRLARNLQQEYGTGTGTTGAGTNRLRLKADTASCDVVVEAFDK